MNDDVGTPSFPEPVGAGPVRRAELWPDLLEHVCQVCEADAAALLVHPGSGVGGIVNATRIAGASVAHFNRNYANLNEWLRGKEGGLRPGVILSGPELFDADAALHPGIVRDWLLPQGFQPMALAGLVRDGDRLAALMLLRAAGRDVFSSCALAALRAVLPPLAALWNRDRLAASATMRLAVAWSLLDQWSLGVIVIDASGRIVTLNQAARQVLANKRGLMLRDGRLAAVRSRDAATLRRAFDELTGAGPAGEPQATKAVAVSRSEGRDPLNLILSRLPLDTIDGGRVGAAFAIFICDHETAAEPPREWLQDLFGLSPVDAQITTLLCQGATIDEIAGRLRASPHTVRAHLKRIFLRMDVNRQADIVRVVLGGIGALNTNGRPHRPASPPPVHRGPSREHSAAAPC